MDTSEIRTVWIFIGEGARLPSGVFASRMDAELWIGQHGLSGLLTEYPIGIGVYDWAIANGHFQPKNTEQLLAKFIGRFSSGNLIHVHYEKGLTVT